MEFSTKNIVVAGGLAVLALVATRLARGRGEKKRPQPQSVSISAGKQRNEAWLKSSIRIASCEAGYRRLVRRHIQNSDNVLELGCHCGTTTVLARSLCGGKVVGLDTSDFNLDKARKEHAGVDVAWVQEDATDTSAVRKAWLAATQDTAGRKAASELTVILLDISGSRPPWTLMELIAKFDRIFSPRLFIVKSYKLYSFVAQSSLAAGGARPDDA